MLLSIYRNQLDSSGITLEYFDNPHQMSLISPNAPVIPLHQHPFYELTLILRGCCEHDSSSFHTPLIPGDLFLIPPNQPHAYHLHQNVSLCNCQFEAEIFKNAPDELLGAMTYLDAQHTQPAKISQKRMRDLQAFVHENPYFSNHLHLHSSHIHLQGIIHLEHNEMDSVVAILKNILAEQQDKKYGFERMKQTLLEQLLVLIRRMQIRQFDRIHQQASWKQEMIDTVLAQIDTNLAKEIDFEAIAQQQGITLTYFRQIFKNYTGLSPVDYLNRVRILQALELLQTSDMPIADIAMKVGIYDANYFSRMFKKITGYPPSYFKAIQHPEK